MLSGSRKTVRLAHPLRLKVKKIDIKFLEFHYLYKYSNLNKPDGYFMVTASLEPVRAATMLENDVIGTLKQN